MVLRWQARTCLWGAPPPRVSLLWDDAGESLLFFSLQSPVAHLSMSLIRCSSILNTAVAVFVLPSPSRARQHVRSTSEDLGKQCSLSSSLVFGLNPIVIKNYLKPIRSPIAATSVTRHVPVDATPRSSSVLLTDGSFQFLLRLSAFQRAS